MWEIGVLPRKLKFYELAVQDFSAHFKKALPGVRLGQPHVRPCDLRVECSRSMLLASRVFLVGGQASAISCA